MSLQSFIHVSSVISILVIDVLKHSDESESALNLKSLYSLNFPALSSGARIAKLLAEHIVEHATYLVLNFFCLLWGIFMPSFILRDSKEGFLRNIKRFVCFV